MREGYEGAGEAHPRVRLLARYTRRFLRQSQADLGARKYSSGVAGGEVVVEAPPPLAPSRNPAGPTRGAQMRWKR